MCPSWKNTLWTPPVSSSSKRERISGFRGSETSRITNPLRRFEAPSRVMTAILPSSDTFTSFTVRASTCTSEIRCMFAGSVTSKKSACPSAFHVPSAA